MKTAHLSKRFFLENQGVAATEFALIAPVLFLLLVGSVEFGLFMNQQMKMENLSRSIAEYIKNGGLADNIWDDVVVAGDFFESAGLEDNLTMDVAEVCECDDANAVDCEDACPAGEYKRYFMEIDLEMNYTPMINYFDALDDLAIRGSTRLQTE